MKKEELTIDIIAVEVSFDRCDTSIVKTSCRKSTRVKRLPTAENYER